MRIAQPALSRQLADLEQELGLNLFDRLGRRLVLTSEGEQLLSTCRALLACGDAVTERARLVRKGNIGVLRVAASPQHIETAFSGLLPLFAQSFPDVQVELREESGREILGMLERGENHFAQNLLFDLRAEVRRFLQLINPDEALGTHRPSTMAWDG